MIGFKIVVVLLLAVVVGGCASSAPATPTPFPAILRATSRAVEGRPPAIAFDKLQVDLGRVPRDQEGVQTFLVLNRGDKPLKIGQVSVRAEQRSAEAVQVLEGEPEIKSGEGMLLPIKFGTHKEQGPYRIIVNVPSNDLAKALETLSVSFEVVEEAIAPGSGPRLRVDKDMIDIGRVPNDWPLYEQFTLRNDGDAPLVIEGTPVVRVEEGC